MRRAAAAVSDRQRRLLINTAVAGVYLALAVVLCISAWHAPSTTYIGQGPDPIQQMWGIAWVPYAISHGLNPLYTSFLNAPTGTDILWSTPTAVVATVLWPVTALFGATVTYNLVMTLGLVLAAFFAFLVIRRWVFGGVVAAAVGGLLYGFSPYMTGQMLGHYNLVLSGVTPPLALMLADELLVRQRMRPVVLGLLGAGLAVVQFFIAQEILLTEAVVGVLFAIVLAITHRHAVRGHAMFVVRTLAVAVPPAVVALAYPIWLQFFGADHVVTAGAIHGTDIYVTDPANFVIPTVAQLISPQVATNISSHFSGNASEWDAYLGIPLILVLLVATVRFWRVPQIRVAGVMALVIAILSLGPHINIGGHPFLALPLPWWIPAHLPVLDDILPNRLMLYVDLAAAIILAFVLRAVWMLQARPLINVVVAAVVLLPLVPTLPAPATTLTVPAVFASTSQTAIPYDSNVLFEPFPSSDYSHAMAWQVAGGFSFSMVGGYIIGPEAPGADALQRLIHALTANATTITLTEAEREPLNIGLRTLRISELVAGPGATPGVVSLFTQLSGSAPTERDGFWFWPAPAFHG
jgi:membrane protein CcdC involved in cytochrome C biogenesis